MQAQMGTSDIGCAMAPCSPSAGLRTAPSSLHPIDRMPPALVLNLLHLHRKYGIGPRTIQRTLARDPITSRTTSRDKPHSIPTGK
jgi:hypothetical protein